jgi:multiple antibiotic resistance protein
MLRDFAKVIIPLFVTIDAVGMVPIFLAVTRGMSPRERRTVTFEAVAGATVIAIAFMFLGDAIFRFLGITLADFQIAGGILLLVLAVLDLLMRGKPAVDENQPQGGGLVPLAMPLIAGPAVLTTTLVLARQSGTALTTMALAINFLFLLFVLLGSNLLCRLVGEKALGALSKLVMILLAAIAVSYIRSGIATVVLDTAAGVKAMH